MYDGADVERPGWTDSVSDGAGYDAGTGAAGDVGAATSG